MCKKLLFVLLLFAIHNANSQDSIRLMVEYKMVHIMDTTQPENPQVTPCILLVGYRMSIFDEYYRAMKNLGRPVDKVYNDAAEIQNAVAGATSDQIAVDFEKQQLITTNYLLNTLYAKEEPLPKIDWQIHEKKKSVLGHECQMATAWFKGRHYTAWFAASLPNTAGPWKLQGLPGIILAANDDKNEVSFTCTKVATPSNNAQPLRVTDKATRISVEKFNKLKKAIDSDPMIGKGMQAQSGRLMAVSGSMAALQTKAKPRTMNNPIEKP
jgi:GLPGLI family protein